MNKALLFLLLILPSASRAQIPTLTTACNPLVGDSHMQYYTDTFVVSPAGAAQTWHFDTLHNYSFDTVSVFACSASPHCSDFPGANIFQHFSDNAVSIYYNTTGGSLTDKGYYYSVSIPYPNAEDQLRYPFTYGSSFSDTFSGNFIVTPYAYGRLGHITVTADAYGTLILPNATYPNALRVHSYETYTDSGNSGGTPYSYNYAADIYAWYVPTVRTEVLEIGRSTTPGGSAVAAYYTSAQAEAVPMVQQAEGITLFPNPASDETVITRAVSFESGSQAAICDLTGKTVAQYPLRGSSTTIPVSKLPPGTYLCQISTPTGEIQVKRLVVSR